MTNNDKLKLAQNVAVISGIFCSVVALLLLLNFWQFSKNDPIESQALEVLVERLKEDPNNDGLKTEIRQYDLLARKAYFSSRWQVKTGAYLLPGRTCTQLEKLKESVAAINEEVAQPVDEAAVCSSLKKGFTDVLKVKLIEDTLTTAEEDLMRKLIKKYSDARWNLDRKREPFKIDN